MLPLSYSALNEQRKQLQRRLYLIKLYAIEKEVNAHNAALTEAQEEIEIADGKHSSAEESVKAAEKEKSRLGRKVVELERKLVGLQRQLEGRNPDTIRLREEMAHTTKRKGMTEKSLEKTVR